MDSPAPKLAEFVGYVRKHLRGDEKSEAQVFCDRLFQAFGHDGAFEAGGQMEFRVHTGKSTRFADLLWRPRLLLEMKKSGEKLHKHYRQAFEYWLHLVPQRPEYVTLCNFDEFWIYDLNRQLDDPMDRVRLDELPERYTALNFLFPEKKKPLFGNDLVAVTEDAAAKVAAVYRSMKDREGRLRSQRFILQCVVALFADHIELIPRGMFSELLDDCRRGASSYDLLGDLFRQMNTVAPAKGGRFKHVPYFNGGLFKTIDPVELSGGELEKLAEAAAQNWSKVKPAIFGSIFQESMDVAERHVYGAHFTSEADIQKVILPTIVRPWRERIAAATTAKQLEKLRTELLKYRVLDPACGSGNFLYLAYRELKRVETELLDKLTGATGAHKQSTPLTSLVRADQFFGIDINSFAVELAKVTLMLGKKLALDEFNEHVKTQQHLPFEGEQALPLDNLDNNIRCEDALFCEWPKADAIIGNPPYQSKNKLSQAIGVNGVAKLRKRYPAVPGRADYCVYWFRRAHDELPPGGRGGLVGTNTIRQNYSREGGLDYIVGNGGTITEAVSTQVWSGEAAVHVSIVNWTKGPAPGLKKLFAQKGDHAESPWDVVELPVINSSLSASLDVTAAERLRANVESGKCYQGQTHGHKGFLLSPDEAEKLISDPAASSVVHPYLIGDELVGALGARPGRFAIDLNHCPDLLSAKRHGAAFAHVEQEVLPDLSEKAKNEFAETQEHSGPRQNHLLQWWKFWRGRPEMLGALKGLARYIACSRITKRQIFEFVSSAIRPNDKLQVFALDDDYSFGVISSGVHWQWLKAKCTTLKGDFNYNTESIWDTFPWPQKPTLPQVRQVAAAAVALRSLRRQVMAEHGWCLRDLYRTLDLPGKNPLRDAHDRLDAAVRAAYGMEPGADPLAFLLALNKEVAAREAAGQPVVAPGLPPCVTDSAPFVTDDCVRMPGPE